MKMRERCSCGAEWEMNDDGHEAGQLANLRTWREWHSTTCLARLQFLRVSQEALPTVEVQG